MSLRALTPEEEIIFDLIVDQRLKSSRSSDYFIYDICEAQKTINANKVAADYGIGFREQHETIKRLADDGFFEADWIDLIFIRENGTAHVTLANSDNDEWGLHYEFGNAIEPYFRGERSEDIYIINLSHKQIKNINDNCRANITCSLIYDEKNFCFKVVLGNKKEYTVSNNFLKPDKRPYEVLKIATKKPGKEFKRNFLDRHLSSDNKIGEDCISSQVFADNSIVRKELQPLVELTVDTIKVKPSAQITSAQLEAIKKISN